jgi:ABC-2 type transport system ATP-binding protein
MTTADSPALELADLTKRFGSTTVVDNLSLSVPRGTTLGLIGPNGAGKSTTIRMLMGMLSITSGQARVLGIDPTRDATGIKRRVGYVPESHHIYRWMRVEDVIWFARSFYEKWNDDLCRNLLELFGLDGRKKIKHLSKGMLAKVSLVVAISHEPEVLILDEPMSGLDPVAREEFLDGVLRTICDHQRTVVFSSHSLSDVQRMADSVAMLYQGKLLLHCPVDDLLASAKRIRAVLNDGCQPQWKPQETVWERVEQREWLLTVNPCSAQLVDKLRSDNPVTNVEVTDLSLEDLFKDYVKGRRVKV